MYELLVPVAGVTFPGRNGGDRQALLRHLLAAFWQAGPEAQARLVVDVQHEPSNPYDENAHSVWIGPRYTPLAHVGYLPAKFVPGLLAEEKAGTLRMKGPWRVHDMGTMDDGTVWVRLALDYAGAVQEAESAT